MVRRYKGFLLHNSVKRNLVCGNLGFLYREDGGKKKMVSTQDLDTQWLTDGSQMAQGKSSGKYKARVISGLINAS